MLPSTSHLLHILNSSLIFDIYSCSVSVSPTNGEFTVATSVAAYCKHVVHVQYSDISVGILSYSVTLIIQHVHICTRLMYLLSMSFWVSVWCVLGTSSFQSEVMILCKLKPHAHIVCVGLNLSVCVCVCFRTSFYCKK